MHTIEGRHSFTDTARIAPPVRDGCIWGGRVLSGLAVLFLLFDSIGKLLQVQPVIDGTLQLGYPRDIVFTLGVVLLSCVLAYVIPRTSLVGAVLLTGYLGGAVATHVRVGIRSSRTCWHQFMSRRCSGAAWCCATRACARSSPWRDRRKVMSQGQVEGRNDDRLRAIRQRPGGDHRGWRVLQPRVRSLAEARAAAGAAFTVYTYDRRGRGQSGDAPPYAPEREIEDIAALMRKPAVRRLSSACRPAPRSRSKPRPAGCRSTRSSPTSRRTWTRPASAAAPGTRRSSSAARGGNRGGAVKYFMKDMVGVPAPIVVVMRLMPWIWRKLQAVAHTLPYDAAVMSEFRVPRARFASIKVPALVMHGSKTDPRLKQAAQTVANVVPGAQHRELAGQTHNVKPEVLAPAVIEFFIASTATPQRSERVLCDSSSCTRPTRTGRPARFRARSSSPACAR